jgi:MFS family permease
VLVIDVASFVATALLMVDVPTPSTDAVSGRLGTQLRTMRQYILRTPVLARLLTAEALTLVFFASAAPIEVVLVKTTLHSTDAGYGAMLAAWGAGMFAGSGIFARAAKQSLGLLVTVSTFGVGLAYLGIGASMVLWVACVFAFVGGTGNGVQWIAFITSIQEKTVSQLQGRVMGVLESMAAFCLGLGFSLGGAVTAVFNPRVTFLMAGGAAIVATLGFARLTLRHRVGLREHVQPGPEPSS